MQKEELIILQHKSSSAPIAIKITRDTRNGKNVPFAEFRPCPELKWENVAAGQRIELTTNPDGTYVITSLDENNSTETQFENFDLCALAVGNTLGKIEDENRPYTKDELACVAELGDAVKKTVEKISSRGTVPLFQIEDRHVKRQLREFDDALLDNESLLKDIDELYENEMDTGRRIDLCDNLGVMIQSGKNLLALKKAGVKASQSESVETNEDSEALTM